MRMSAHSAPENYMMTVIPKVPFYLEQHHQHRRPNPPKGRRKDVFIAVYPSIFYTNVLSFSNYRLKTETNSFVKKRLCPKCFRGNCEKGCRFRCFTCKGHHNTLIHVNRDFKGESNTITAITAHNNFVKGLNESMHSCNYAWVGSVLTDDELALLATTLVEITDTKNQPITARALLDSASQYNFTTANGQPRKQITFTSYSLETFDQVHREPFWCVKVFC